MKSVVVIGAGASGLASIKCCLEAGFDVTCYELSEYIGGLWKYREDSPEHVAVLQKSTIINSSKELSAYSDFPPPAEFSNFMHNRTMWSYFDLYASKFNLTKHINFNHQVTSCTRNGDYDSTGRWLVKGINKTTGEAWEKVADAVMVCNGHLACPNLPKFAGIENFKGKVLHTREYKSTIGYEDKNVLVIGIGNSASDAAVELSTVTNQLYLSTRTGAWILGRIGHKGVPSDFQISRFLTQILTWFPNLLSKVIQADINRKFDHELYGLKPKHSVFQQHPSVNDDLPNRIASGRIQIKGDVDHFTENGVVFKGQETEYKLDAVVLGTGYLLNFPFVEDEILNFNRELNQVKLYKYILPPQLKHSSLAVIGLIQPFGSLIPLAEAQARWFMELLQGNFKLPSQDKMMGRINETAMKLSKRFKTTTRYTLEVDFQEYVDDITKDFGARPNLFRLLVTDPKLWYACVFGPILPYQFRLQGPHTWEGAREAILNVDDRVSRPFSKPPNHDVEVAHSKFPFIVMLIVLFGSVFVAKFYM